jgi:predicted Rdx family selenoprotein
MELKPSHEMFAQELVVNKGNLTSAYTKAYPKASYQSCRQGGWLLSKNVNIQKRLRELLEQHGLGLESCIKKLTELTEAKKVQTYGRAQVGTFPDNFIRLQAVQTALKIHMILGNVEQTVKEHGTTE